MVADSKGAGADYSSDEKLFAAADFNASATITTTDARELLRYTLGTTSEDGSIVIEDDNGNASLNPDVAQWKFFNEAQEKNGVEGSEDIASFSAIVTGDVTQSWQDWASDNGVSSYEFDTQSGPEIVSEVSVDIAAEIASGKVVYTAVATDNGYKVFYDLVGEPEGINIDRHSGEVTLDAPTAEETPISFEVVATDENNLTATSNVTLNVLDIPDTEAPVIDSVEQVTIAEDLSDNVIYTATATDAYQDQDRYEGEITFSLSDDSDDALVIDASTGDVSLSKDADYEDQSAYNFKVIATDSADNSSVQKVVVNISNLDEKAPEITSTDKAASIVENSGAGQVVYTATAVDSDDVSGGMILGLTGDDADAFVISNDEDTFGQVTLLDNPDADVKSQYNFTVIVSDGVQDVEQNVTLDINNIDDTNPEITSSDSAEAISENSGAGQVVYTAAANDSADVSSGVSFSLAGDDADAFRIDSETGEVKLLANPNFEGSTNYNFDVVVTDVAGLKDSKSVSLAINNLDELAATLTVSDQQSELDENSGAGALVLSVTANDSDDTSDGVTLELAGADAAAFTLTNGEVTLNDDLNHEAQSSYSFSVVATDAAGNKSEVSHTLSVKDLDEVAPTFTANADVAVVENSGANQVIYKNESGSVASDSKDASDDLTFDISEYWFYQNTPEVSESEQAVFVGAGWVQYDADKVEVEVAYMSESNELPGLGLRVHYDSSVLSVQDMTDVFAGDLIFANDAPEADDQDLDGNAATDAYVTIGWASLLGNWTATELPEHLLTMVFDIGDASAASTAIGFSAISQPVEYEFNGVNFDLQLNPLEVNSETGEVALNVDPDYETQQEYNFTINAADGEYTSSEYVYVSVINVDDTKPTITSGEIAVSIDENSGGKVIYSTQVDDSADFSEGPITYSLGQHDAGIAISAVTGDVYLLEDPDHESKDEYSFEVIATDSTDRQITESVKLTINDLDDTADTITSGDTAVAIDENSGDAQVIYTATSEDLVDVSVDLVYSLAEGSDEALSINADTGEVSLNADPDYEAQTEYSFGVFVTDGAGNVSATQQVTLDINNLDEVAPTITSVATADAIDENSGAGQTVYAASADDSGDISDGVTYSLAGTDADAFVIDTASGAVTLSANPNYESQTDYSFDVVATDAAGNASTQSVSLDINNLDEIAPTIAPDGNALIEAGTENEVIYTASVVDDADTSEGFTLSLSGADASAFTISNDEATFGQVTLNEAARASGYDFNVVATDVASNATDDANNASQQAVSVGVYQVVTGPQSIAGEAAIMQEFTHNPDGTISLNLVFDKEEASQVIYGDNTSLEFVHNIDFDLTYSGAVTDKQVSYPGNPFFLAANESNGTIEVSQFFPSGSGLQGGDSVMQVTFDLPGGAADFTVSNVLINDEISIVSADGVNSSITVNDQQGTSGDDIFELGAGYSNVYTGAGVDTLIVTEEADASVVVDFDSGSDKFDMAQLLSGAGYDADSDLEGVFGASLDGGTNVLSFTIDEEDVAEVTLSDGSTFEDDDLSADFSAFIA
jgi:hypothetical protein